MTKKRSSSPATPKSKARTLEKAGLNKARLLLIMDLLRKKSDKENIITKDDIISYLEGKGVPISLKTLTGDIEALNHFGYEVMEGHDGHKKGYYVQVKDLTPGESQTIIDLLQSANYISDDQTQHLIERIRELGGKTIIVAKNNSISLKFRKRSNQETIENVGSLSSAVQLRKKVSFKLFRMNGNKEKVEYNGGRHYIVDPVGTVVNNDHLYLIYLEKNSQDLHKARLDRMTDLQITSKEVVPRAIVLRKDLKKYMNSIFSMYGGETKSVCLSFTDDAAEMIYDQFGEDVCVRPDERHPGRFCIVEYVQVSGTFFGWLAQMNGKITIEAPIEVRNEYYDYLRGLLPRSQD